MNPASNPSKEIGQQALAGKYLTFVLGQESFGLRILKVREIIRMAPITLLPNMPSHIRGVLNLRGKIVPVLDLRLKLGLPATAATEHTCIVVVQVRATGGLDSMMGLIVDGVEEVLNISAADIEEAPDFGSHVDTQYILGMAKVKGVVKTLLEIDQVVAAETAAVPVVAGQALKAPAVPA
jgi:purine-binding chemotaxis protein CheW